MRFWPRRKDKQAGERQRTPQADMDREIPRYPPFLRGLPVPTTEELLETQTEMIARLQDGIGCTNEIYAELVMPVVRRYADFVHLLPASESHHHRGAGGLFRHGLEVGFYASQSTRRHVYGMDREPRIRRQLEPRWRMATALAGLCHDIGKPVSDLSVSDRDGHTTWRPMLETLTEWAGAHGVDRYFLHWRDRRHNRHETFGMLVLERVLTAEVKAWLSEIDAEIMQGMLSTVAGLDDGSIMNRLVLEADRTSVETDLRENHIEPEAASLGVPVDRYIVDAMRRLVRNGTWSINTPGSRLWMLDGHLHVVWPRGGEEISQLLSGDRVPGIPRDPDTLADILLERGHAVASRGKKRYWRLAPACLETDGKPITLGLLRLNRSDLVLTGATPASVALSSPAGTSAATAPEGPVDSIPEGQILPLDLDEPEAFQGADHLPEEALPEAGAADGRDASTRRTKASRKPQRKAAEGQSADAPESEQEGHRRARLAARDKKDGTDRKARTAPASAQKDRGEDAEQDSMPPHAHSLFDPADEARTYLRARGEAGRVLMEIADAIAAGSKSADLAVAVSSERMLLHFPEAFEGLEKEPAKVVSVLAAAGMVVVDPRKPLLHVRVVDNVRGVVLTDEISKHLVSLLQFRSGVAHETESTLPDESTPESHQDSVPAATTNAEQSTCPVPSQIARSFVALVAADSFPGAECRGERHIVPKRILEEQAQGAGIKLTVLMRALGAIAGCRLEADGTLVIVAEDLLTDELTRNAGSQH